MRGKFVMTLGGSLLVAASSAMASDQPGTLAWQWFEENSGGINGNPDAGQVIGMENVTRGASDIGLTQLKGTLVNNRDVDLYCINITDPAAFSATSSANTFGFNGLFLFTANGSAVAGFHGDSTSGTAMLPVGSAAAAGPGHFLLAVTRNDSPGFQPPQYPLDAAGLQMFASGSGLVPVTPGAGTLASWSSNPSPGFGSLFNTNYTVALTGCDYCAIPTPGAFALLGLGGLTALRRRR